MAYDNQCGNCQYYDSNGYDPDHYPSYYKGYCSLYKSYEYPGNSCSNQKPRDYVSSGCYITTILCDVLGMEDNADILNTLRGFRDNVMQKDPKYLETLQEYDVLGPVISENIKEEYNESNDKFLWNQVFETFIRPTSNLIKIGNYDLAVSKYKEMVLHLKSFFAIGDEVYTIRDYDISRGGHGKVYTLPKTKYDL